MKMHITKNIWGLGRVSLKHLTIGNIRDAYKMIEDIEVNEQSTKFSNFILSRIICEPEISTQEINNLDNKTIIELVNFAVVSLDILHYFTQTPIDLSHRERFYVAFNNHEKDLFNQLSQTKKPHFEKILKGINKQYFDSFK